ncbi:glycoside hydrolase family 31 protein [Serendipita vermifera MAFF 305830]|uniref:Glucosidase II subunit alpha n=1 Tax=Serendipita vermifera MAFF 305830 TaxID=933852 RepID=A0A0C3BH30_SERVB|nr:glycoside hydrolase family 31 protein [Serendipita vermifera MAFF 305830]
MWLPLGLVLLAAEALAVKRHDFKTCDQSGFCKRGRALASRAKEAASTWKSPYSVDPSSVAISAQKSTFTASVLSSLYPEIKFELDVRAHADGTFRVRMDEVDGLRKRYDETSKWALVREPTLSETITWKQTKKEIKAVNTKSGVELKVQFEPLRVALLRNGKEEVVINGKGLLHMEHFRLKDEEPTPPVEGQAQDDSQTVLQPPVNPTAWFEGEQAAVWDETFGGQTDTKPRGPQSLSLDINFPTHGHIYGIPEHATRLDLPTTTGENAKYSDPYRLYNLDVFEYEADSEMALYGAVPLVHAHGVHSTVGVFNAIGSETWVDVGHPSTESTETQWISESGILDVFLLPGPTPEDVFRQYARLTGTPVMPRHFALAYHQCRWNYISSSDVREVQSRFDADDIPFDVLWLDIEYAPNHKYFIWNEKTFPDPVPMFNDVAAYGRKMVVIIDPHLKKDNDYPVYKSASEKGLLVKPSSGQGEYDGWCWPGSSAWVDYFNLASWDWWQGLFKVDGNNGDWHWKDSTTDVFIWNDMNEPSVFNGPEITMPKTNLHFDGWEHRDVHNINGMLFQNATSQAVKYRTDPPQRPFVLSRAFFAGSQRFGAVWTGDNLGTWEHMAIGVPMVLSNGIAGITFSGADVGGFFGNPDIEMLVRWYQVGAFAPFFRAHAHIDTKRREPFLLSEPHKSMVRDIIRLRYSLLPVWYTAFRYSSVSGVPVLRPQYTVFPNDPKGFSLDEQYFIGNSGLLVKPVTAPGVTQTTVYLAEAQPYYDYFTGHIYRGKRSGVEVTVPAALHEIPLLIRGGSIVPTRERPRRSSALMKKDPFTLRIALDAAEEASGDLYLDDGDSYLYEAGELVWRRFNAAKSGKSTFKITSEDLVAINNGQNVVDGAIVPVSGPNAFKESVSAVRVEKIVVYGLKAKPSKITLANGGEVEWDFVAGTSAKSGEGVASALTMRDPAVRITEDWSIEITL